MCLCELQMNEGPYLAVASGKFVFLFSICTSNCITTPFKMNETMKFINLLENHENFPLFSKMRIPLLFTNTDGRTFVYDVDSVNL
jgi:hypothetical protein